MLRARAQKKMQKKIWYDNVIFRDNGFKFRSFFFISTQTLSIHNEFYFPFFGYFNSVRNFLFLSFTAHFLFSTFCGCHSSYQCQKYWHELSPFCYFITAKKCVVFAMETDKHSLHYCHSVQETEWEKRKFHMHSVMMRCQLCFHCSFHSVWSNNISRINCKYSVIWLLLLSSTLYRGINRLELISIMEIQIIPCERQ